MSPTATASSVRRAWAPRWLVIAHRYLGVAMGGLMLVWCLSGMVMLFAPYPSVTPDERLAHLPRIDWSRCCRMDAAAPPDAPVRSAVIEQLGAAPVLRLGLDGGPERMIDLSTGRAVAGAGRPDAVAVAGAWGRVDRVIPLVRDQWTVSGEFNRGRPFWRVRLADPGRSDIYVSRVTGEVVQRTTLGSRVTGWLGAVPHWLYPTLLRQNTRLWSQVVIWTSLAGVFLTLAGLYLGLVAWRPFGDHRLSPFRGLMTWHHLTGLAAGLLTLAWVASGLVSMNPWGFLERGEDPAPGLVAGPPPAFAEVRAALQSVAALAPPAAQVRLAPLDGRAFILAGDLRLDAEGRAAPIAAADLSAAGQRLGPVASQGLMTSEDAYYFSHHETVTLPVWRVRLADGRRVYLDPRSGALLASFDATAKSYRWLHQGLHRLDIVPAYRQGPVWAAATLILLLAAVSGVATGVWLGCRRIGHDIHQLRGRLRAP